MGESAQLQGVEQASIAACDRVTRRYVRGNPRSSLLPWRRTHDRPVVTALQDVSVTIRQGEFVGITGPSGSGKSTLLHVLSGLDTPTSGTVTIHETRIDQMSERQRSRLRLETVGIVFQHFHLLPALTARANVALPLVEAGMGTRARRARATELLDRVGLRDRQDHHPDELSGGEQQRVAVARALANDPELLVADEPTGELDSETGATIIELLGSVATERAVVVASHDPQVIDAVDRTVELRDGTIVND